MPDTPHYTGTTPDYLFFMATTKLEKVQQMNALALESHYPAIFFPITALGEPAPSPEEETWSFENNMMTKSATAAQFLNGISQEKTRKALRSLGFSEERISRAALYGCAEDSGFSYAARTLTGKSIARLGKPNGNGGHYSDFNQIFFDTSAHGPYTTDTDKELVNGLRRFYKENAPFPGTETIRVFGAAGGVKNLFRLLNLSMEKAGITLDPRYMASKDAACLELLEECTIGAFPWTPGQPIELYTLSSLVQITQACTRAIYDATPRTPHEETTPFSYTIPRQKARQGEFISREELGVIFQPQSRNIAVKAMMRKLHVKTLPKERWNHFSSERTYSLATELASNPFTVALAPDSDGYLSHPRRKLLAEHCRNAGIQLNINAGETPDSVQPAAMWNDLVTTNKLLKSSDAFVLMPDPAPVPDNGRDLEKSLLLSKILIHLQLDPDGKDKLLVIYDPDRTSWEAPYQQVLTLFNRGVYGDRPSKVIKRPRDMEELVETLKDKRIEYRRVSVGQEPETPVPEVGGQTGKYNVCVFMSAALEGIYEEKTEYLGYRLQQEGMGLVWGAGNRNMMGGLYKGSIRHQNETGEPMTLLGSSTRNILTQETDDGHKPEMIPDAFFYLAPGIDERKMFFFKNSHAFVCMEGGIGTLDELHTYMWLKENRPDIVKDKPIIIAESAYTGDTMFRSVITSYLGKDYAEMTSQEREEKGIIVLEAPVKLAGHAGSASPPTLYEMEMEAVIRELKKYREKYHPDLAATLHASRYQRRSAEGTALS